MREVIGRCCFPSSMSTAQWLWEAISGALKDRPLFTWPWSEEIDVEGDLMWTRSGVGRPRGRCRSGQGVRSGPYVMVDSMVSRTLDRPGAWFEGG